jgi:SAM-dependent methyltransferase
LKNELFHGSKGGITNFQELKELVVHELLANKCGLKFLDFGCGYGTDMRFFQTFEPIGVDVSKKKLMMAKKYGEVILASGECLPFKDGCFNIVMEDHVLHHLRSAYLGLSEIRRCLGRGGFFFFNEVVENNPLISIGRTIYPYYEGIPVTSRFRKEDINNWLCTCDFRIVTCGEAVFILGVWNALVQRFKFLGRITRVIASLEVWLENHLNKFAGHYFGLAKLNRAESRAYCKE